jgi:MHS family proline/betaine transporter-like MFS transporter
MASARTSRIIVAGMIGNALEWYDFAVYGYFAVAIGHQFFPQTDSAAQLLATFGVFALGYLMRPIGGVIIGDIGDRYGRRAALTVSIAAMAIPTFLIGLLPGYQALGLLAPLLFTFLRMLQGLSVGGEFPSSMVFLVERASPGRRGFSGAFGPLGGSSGILLGSAVGAGFAATMSAASLDSWGWRIPFLLGLLVGLAGFLVRRYLPEQAAADRFEGAPIVETLRDHWRVVVRLAALSVFCAVGFYVAFVYVATWLQTAVGLSAARALEINTVSMVVLLPVTLAGGWLSDRLGRKPVMVAATLTGIVAGAPLFLLMQHPSVVFALLGQLGLALIIGLFVGALPSAIVEAAPERVRCTAVALGYNTTLGIVGGLTPLAATWLVQRTGDEVAPGFLIMAAAAISLIAVFGVDETYRKPIAAEALPQPG